MFIAFRKEAINNWLKRDAVQQRGKKLAKGFDIWRKQKGIAQEKAKFPGLPYIMLHSLSHLLIAAVSLECGYAASSIRERIYDGESGYGILLYTGSQSRDTGVVVRELFSSAKTSVLISSFAIDKRQKARELFMVLAEQMDLNPELNVRMFLNVKRPHNSEVPTSSLLREFASTFRQDIWPGKRLPEVFHDPRSLTLGVESKACLHAKCVVVDQEHVLVTSANFTEAAHERNIEAGVLLNDPVTAIALQMQFESLVTRNILCRIPGV